MIIHEKKTVFVHIPKTAGVSFVRAFLSQLTGQNYDAIKYVSQMPSAVLSKYHIVGEQKHRRAQDYTLTDLTMEQWTQYYKFAIVRNPWDRMVSEYVWRKRLNNTFTFTDFESFIKQFQDIQDGNHSTSTFDERMHAATQKSLLTLDGDIIVDDVFRFENLRESIETIKEKVGINFTLNHFNATQRKSYQTYYNPQTIEMVGNLYNEDIETFEYKF